MSTRIRMCTKRAQDRQNDTSRHQVDGLQQLFLHVSHSVTQVHLVSTCVHLVQATRQNVPLRVSAKVPHEAECTCILPWFSLPLGVAHRKSLVAVNSGQPSMPSPSKCSAISVAATLASTLRKIWSVSPSSTQAPSRPRHSETQRHAIKHEIILFMFFSPQ